MPVSLMHQLSILRRNVIQSFLQKKFFFVLLQVIIIYRSIYPTFTLAFDTETIFKNDNVNHFQKR